MSRSSRRSPAVLTTAMCLCLIGSMLPVYAVASVLPRLSDDWSLSSGEAGWLTGISFAVYAVTVPFVTRWTDRVDARRIFTFSILLIVAAAVGLGVLAKGFASGIFCQAGLGAGLAGTFMPGLKALIDRVPDETRPRATAFYTSSFGLGTASSFFITGTLAGVLPWRSVLAIEAGVAAAAFVVGLIILLPRPIAEARSEVRANFRAVLSDRSALTYVLAYTGHMWELFAARAWMVTFLTFVFASSATSIRPTTVVATGSLLATFGSVVGSELAARFGRVRVVVSIMVASVSTALMLGWVSSVSVRAGLVLCILYLILLQSDSAALYNGVLDRTPASRSGTALALQSLCGFSGAAVAPLVVGLVLDATGGGRSTGSWMAALAVMAAGSAAGALVLALRRPPSPAARPVRAVPRRQARK